MGTIAEVFRRIFQESPRKKERAELASQFRGKMEGLLGGLGQKKLNLDGVQIAELTSHMWERPATIAISREPYGFCFAIATDMTGKALELHGNRPRIFETTKIGEGYSGYTPTEGNPLAQEIDWLRDWIRYATYLEGLRASSPTPSASVS